jgi:hypothetical protein
MNILVAPSGGRMSLDLICVYPRLSAADFRFRIFEIGFGAFHPYSI